MSRASAGIESGLMLGMRLASMRDQRELSELQRAHLEADLAHKESVRPLELAILERQQQAAQREEFSSQLLGGAAQAGIDPAEAERQGFIDFATAFAKESGIGDELAPFMIPEIATTLHTEVQREQQQLQQLIHQNDLMAQSIREGDRQHELRILEMAELHPAVLSEGRKHFGEGSAFASAGALRNAIERTGVSMEDLSGATEEQREAITSVLAESQDRLRQATRIFSDNLEEGPVREAFLGQFLNQFVGLENAIRAVWGQEPLQRFESERTGLFGLGRGRAVPTDAFNSGTDPIQGTQVDRLVERSLEELLEEQGRIGPRRQGRLDRVDEGNPLFQFLRLGLTPGGAAEHLRDRQMERELIPFDFGDSDTFREQAGELDRGGPQRRRQR